MRPVVFFDTFRKYLEYIGYSVKYVSRWTGFPSPVVKIVIDTILFFISYKIQQMWVFKKNKDKD